MPRTNRLRLNLRYYAAGLIIDTAEMIASTNIGIKVFDGSHFNDYFDYDTHTDRNGIAKLVKDEDDHLWGVNQFGLFEFFQEKFTTYKLPIKYNTFNSLEVINNVPCVISNFNLFKFVDHKFVSVNNSIQATSVARGINNKEILVGSKGKIYIISDDGKIFIRRQLA